MLDDGSEPLFRFAELLLGFAPLGDVEDDPLREAEVAELVPEHDGLVVHPDPSAVSVPVPILGFVREPILIVTFDGSDHPIVVVRVQAKLPQFGLPLPLLGRVAVDLLHLRTDVDRP